MSGCGCGCGAPQGASCGRCGIGSLDADQDDSGGLPGCAPGPGNELTTDYACSLAVQLQGVVDQARRQQHLLGFRPYRATLVWQERDAQQRYREIKRIELMPCEVKLTSQFTRIQWMLSTGGSRPDGDLQLFQISPAQVTMDDLRGRLDGQDPPDGVEFFYEITRDARCAGDSAESWRYALKSLPFLDAAAFQIVVDITSQITPRNPDETLEDRDQVHQVPERGKEPEIRF